MGPRRRQARSSNPLPAHYQARGARLLAGYRRSSSVETATLTCSGTLKCGGRRSPDQATAAELAKFANPRLLPAPLEPPRIQRSAPRFAFLGSLAEIERGPIHEFVLQHVVDVDDPAEQFRSVDAEVGQCGQRADLAMDVPSRAAARLRRSIRLCSSSVRRWQQGGSILGFEAPGSPGSCTCIAASTPSVFGLIAVRSARGAPRTERRFVFWACVRSSPGMAPRRVAPI